MRTTWEKVRTSEVLAEDQWCYEQVVDDGYLLVVTGPDPVGCHVLTISHYEADGEPGRWPTWDEVMDARGRFCPTHITMAVLMPGAFINRYDATIHLRELVKA